jgi:hypothetical protein
VSGGGLKVHLLTYKSVAFKQVEAKLNDNIIVVSQDFGDFPSNPSGRRISDCAIV